MNFFVHTRPIKINNPYFISISDGFWRALSVLSQKPPIYRNISVKITTVINPDIMAEH